MSKLFEVVFTDGAKGPKLTDVELHFTEAAGPLFGLKLIGFAIWEARSGGRRNVTMPARQYSVNGERRSFALLRPCGITTIGREHELRDAILQAWEASVSATYEVTDKGKAVLAFTAAVEATPVQQEKAAAKRGNLPRAALGAAFVAVNR